VKAVYENHYLSDADVANYARQSFAKLADNFTEAQNAKLIQFLARGMASGDWETLIERIIGVGDSSQIQSQKVEEAKELASYLRQIPCHWVPFGHPHISLRMQAPVPIARQAFKHKQGFIESEESRRYISTRPEYFVPEYFRTKAANVKQGSGNAHERNDAWKASYVHACNEAIHHYELMLEDGVCPEQARFILPQGCEVNWIWTGSLYAFANFFNMRTDPHAQKEIQILADQVGSIIAPLYPVTWTALTRAEY
jgi:thymidylate synthase (FAD)